jgi:DNA repair photolyase
MDAPASDRIRWRLTDDDGGQPALFDAVERVPGTHELAGLEFLHVHAKQVINRVPDASRMPFQYTINPYRGCSHACVYCFARPTHEYLGLDSGRDFDTKIVVKVNAVERVRAELASARWQRELIALGTNTDPYQACEKRYRLTRGVLEALADAANPVSITTKSPLVERDVDVLTMIASVAAARVDVSIGCVDPALSRRVEPHAPSPQARLRTVATLADAGITVGVFAAPILPGLTDSPQQLGDLARAAVDAGAQSIATIPLHLRPGVRDHYLAWLADAAPSLVVMHDERYRGSYLPARESRALGALVQEHAAAHRRAGHGHPPGRAPRLRPRRVTGTPKVENPSQLTLL